MRLVLKRGKFLFFFFILFVISNSCDKIQDSQVPSVPFSFTINLTIANELTIPGNSMFFAGAGYGGVIVYCADFNEYYAYDATCTYEISQTCKVVNSGVVGECSCCSSKFLFTGGAYPAKGPAAAPLRQYNVSRMSSVMLRVYNY
jgi:nitrite reductase/ring-hydroxylating ferredoxin subunit